MFDWTKDDETDEKWDETPITPAPAAAERPFLTGASRLTAVVGICLLVLTVGVVLWQTQRRVQAATAEIESELADAHQLLLHTAMRGDVELLKTMLSGRDRAWTNAQLDLVAAGVWHQSPGFTITDTMTQSLAYLSTVEPLTVTLSPDLKAAELVYKRPFTLHTPAGLTETIQLAQTAVYRQGPQSWLYAPPETEFWGNWRSYDGQRLQLAYSARDAHLVESFAPHLDAQLERLCQETSFTCEPSWQQAVRLARDPNSLFMFSQPTAVLTATSQLELPTPSLLGLPVDAAGAEALAQLYETAVLTAAITDLSAYECCRAAPITQLLIQEQLHQLGYPGLTLDETDYKELSTTWNRGGVNVLWSGVRPPSGQDVHQAQSLINFLQANYPQVTLAQMITAVSTNRINYRTWLNALLEDAYDERAFTSEWDAFVFAQTNLNQPETLPALPTASFQMLCYPNYPQSEMSQVVYDFETAVWQSTPLYSTPTEGNSVYANILPSSNIITIVDTHFDNETGIQTNLIFVWRDGDLLSLDVPQQSGDTVYPLQADPSGRYISAYKYNSQTETPAYYLFDLSACSQDVCPGTNLISNSWLQWSPNGRYALLVDNSFYRTEPPPQEEVGFEYMRNALYLASANGEPITQISSNGGRPVWIDNEHIAFMRIVTRNGEKDIALYVYDIETGESTRLLSSADIKQLIPPEQLDNEQIVRFGVDLISLQSENTSFMVTAYIENLNQDQTLWFEVETDDALTAVHNITLRHTGQSGVTTQFSPDGTWLTTFDYLTSGPIYDVELHNLQNNMTYTIQDVPTQPRSLIWSPDSNWIVFSVHTDELIFLHPDSGYRFAVPFDHGRCDTASWVQSTE